MSSERFIPPQSVPTLTEVVTLPAAASAVPVSSAAAQLPAGGAPLTESQLTERILSDLQHQVDAVLEYRVREVLTPILARATDALVRDARNELSTALRDVVARSVAQELLKQRSR